MKKRLLWSLPRCFLFAAALFTSGCSNPDKANDKAQSAEPDAQHESQVSTAKRVHPAAVDGERISEADNEPGNWLSHGRTYNEQRFSPLAQINASSVSKLGVAWFWDTGTMRGLEATPIVVDGVMYTSGSWSIVWAHDAKTGELLWEYDPKVPKSWARNACCDVVNRGVAAWKGKIYIGALDGRLIALDAGTGKPVWEVQTTDPQRPYTITGAPRIVKDQVIIGNGGAEYGVRGYITAYDTGTGEQRWRFYTVPGDPSKPFESPAMEQAAKTWHGSKWWEIGGGGTVWDSMAYDAELNLLYIGVGNGTPWNQRIRSPGGGDNLYLSSIVAINPDNGNLAWFYQTTPGETWDYTATQHMILADIEIAGNLRKVLMQAPKNGFFYVIDRTNGEFISARNYVPINWATHVDQITGRPVETPNARYADKSELILPSPFGGHNWQPMAFNPNTGLVYIPALDMPYEYESAENFKYDPKGWNTGTNSDTGIPGKKPEDIIESAAALKGHLSAWDPVQQKEVWRVQHRLPWNGGLLSTAGNLVFQGRSDGQFAAYKADSGELVWESPVHTGIIAAPISYSIDGEQYIAVVAGWGGAYSMAVGAPRHPDNVLLEGRILAFKLGGTAALPRPNVTFVEIPVPPAMDTTPAQFTQGESLFHRYCAVCHGPAAVAAGAVPDLRYTNAATHASWDAIVLQGAYSGNGMVGFGDRLSADDSRAIQAYVIETARHAITLCESEFRQQYPEIMNSACTRAQVAEAK